MEQLRQVCAEGRTGTVMLVTRDSQLARLLIDRGNIVFVGFGTRVGLEAVSLIKEVKEARVHFSEDKLVPRDEGGDLEVDVLPMLLGEKAVPIEAKAAPAAAILKVIESELIDCV